MTAATAAHGSTAAPGFPGADAVLARATGENFAVTTLLLGRAATRHLTAVYGFARLVDELGDAAEGDRLSHLDRAEHELDLAYTGEPEHPLFRSLAATIRACNLPRGPFLRLIEANRRDQTQTEYATFAELLDYCTLSANPVGELVLHIFGAATPERILLSDSVCTALQVIEHLQDVREDALRGRVYLPAEDRSEAGVTASDLTATVTGDPLRRVIALESERAATLLAAGTALVASLRGRARLAVAGYVGGGRAALEALAAGDYDVLSSTLRASRARRMTRTVQTLVEAAR